MKKIFIYIFFITILFLNKEVGAISYTEEIKLDLNPVIVNTENNINWARLIEKYLSKLKKELEIFNTKYDITWDKETTDFFKKIDKMILSLRKIQTISVEKNTAEEVMSSIIKEMKELNPKIKKYLKNKKISIEKETSKVKENYSDFSEKLSKSLSIFTIELSLKLKKSEIKNKDIILEHIKNLEKENRKLVNFDNIFFNNPSEVKSSFIRILNNIKREISEIKKLLK